MGLRVCNGFRSLSGSGEMMPTENTNRCRTGIAGLDDILRGGFPKKRLFLIQGDPGVGKTTLALQYLLAGVAEGERVLYITLSETREELQDVASSHGWDLSGIDLFELSAVEQQLMLGSENTLFHASDIELNRLTRTILDEVERVNPRRLVFDSLSELRLLSESALRHRRQILAFKQYFSGRDCTVLLLDDQTMPEQEDSQVLSIAHGVITLEIRDTTYGVERRRLKVNKLRGSKFRGGFHDYVIEEGGIQVFPRLVAAEHHAEFPKEVVSSGINEFDRLLGGGLARGTSALILGPAGVGKSAIVLRFVVAAAERGERVLQFVFDENLSVVHRRAEALEVDLKQYIADGRITLQQIDPAELSPGEFTHRIFEAVEKKKVRLVAIDSINGFLHAMPDEKSLNLQLHELLAYLGQNGVSTLMTVTQQGLVGNMQSPVDVTYVADTVVLLRYFETKGTVKKAISVIKKRSGAHEEAIRELKFEAGGIRIGEPLSRFQGILSGTPRFLGEEREILQDRK